MELRRELRHIWKNYDWYQMHFTESVLWYEFIPFGNNPATDSYLDPVYDEAVEGTGGRRYKDPVILNTILATETEDQRRAIPEGRNPLLLVHLVFSVRDLLVSGLSNTWEYQGHLNDMFYYQDRFYSVNGYRVRGRLKHEDAMIVVEGIEVEVPEEMANDPGPTLPTAIDPWPAAFPSI